MITDAWDDAFEVFEDSDPGEVRDDTSGDDSDAYEVISLATSDLAASPEPCASPVDEPILGRRIALKKTRAPRPSLGPTLCLDDDADIV
jgi:hypothetical protein